MRRQTRNEQLAASFSEAATSSHGQMTPLPHPDVLAEIAEAHYWLVAAAAVLRSGEDLMSTKLQAAAIFTANATYLTNDHRCPDLAGEMARIKICPSLYKKLLKLSKRGKSGTLPVVHFP